MNKKEILYDRIQEYVRSLKLDSYHTIFLSNMVLRKKRHPREKMNEIAFITMKKMIRIHPKKNVLETSWKKSLDQLESALDRCDNIPEDWKRGQIVSNVVKEIAQIIDD